MKYYRNEKEHVLCLIRKRLILLTEEERVRQDFILELIRKYKVPKSMIEVEIPMSYFGKGLVGRADIIVYKIDEKTKEECPLILVECKRPNIQLTDRVYHQAERYNEIVKAKLVIVTNELETVTIKKNRQDEEYDELENIPTYLDAITKNEFKKKIYIKNWSRPNHLSKTKNSFSKLFKLGIIGEDTEKTHVSFFSNLYGLLLDPQIKKINLSFQEYNSIEDHAVRYTTFGNSAGGNWTGDYRHFLLENKSRDHQIISLTIMGKSKTINDPKYRNSRGNTMLLVAIDNDEKSHLSLQLALDRFMKVEGNKYTIFHDGTLTVGNKGPASKIDVISYVKAQKPDLVRNNKILLGTLDNSSKMTFDNKDVKAFMKNIIEYAIIRDEFRKKKMQSLFF